MLELLTDNKYTIQDSFTFAEELQSFKSKLVMASFDTESLLSAHWGINPPPPTPFKKTTSSFLPSPSLKSAHCPSSLFRWFLLIYCFSVNPLCVENLLKDKTYVDNLPKILSVCCLLWPCLNYWSYLIMNSITSIIDFQWVYHYNQLSMLYHDKMRYQNCPSKIKLVIYITFIDDIFLPFRLKYHIKKFRN